MALVQKLSEDMIRGIAAGEVVERPASVLKELIENSLDAGARHVDVEWRGAGRQRLRVVDDGGGMTPEDARLALERHATSKIRDWADLERVETFGFRGEALPSIMAVSRFALVTRTAQNSEAWSIRSEAGRITFDGPAGAPVGTSITADDLFFAVPARLKFLKSDATERAQLFRAVEDASLAAPGASFRVLSENKEALLLPPCGDRLEEWLGRLEILWGAERTQTLKFVEETGRWMRVRGWVSDLHQPQSTARYQRFFVNRRAVTSRRLLHALYDGYRGRLLVGKHPAALLWIEVDPALVDVNVHPAKREVRLSHEPEAHDFIARAVQNALNRSVQAREVFGEIPQGPPRNDEASLLSAPSVMEERGDFFRAGGGSKLPVAENRRALALEAPLPLTKETKGEEQETVTQGFTLTAFRETIFEPVAQLYSTYILARSESDFFLFDQHAAAERTLFEILSDRAARGAPARQVLLLPWVWEPSPEASAVIQAQQADFESLGFSLEPFGGRAWRILSVPAVFVEGDRARALLEGLVEDLLVGRIPRGWEAFLVRAACRGAVKAGDSLSVPEMAHLIRELQIAPHPWTCPHGRPSFLKFSDQDLAKRFRRT